MNEREIFLKAIEIDEPELRAKFIRSACGKDEKLMAQVQALLAADAQSGEFLQVPALQQLAASEGGQAEFGPTNVLESERKESIDLSFLKPSAQPDSLGSIGHFEVREVLGQGGCGIVLKGFDTVLQRMVAIKVMAPELATTSPARKRFLREARAAAAIRHDNVVNIYSVEDRPIPYLVMEYIAGQTLQERINLAGPLPLKDVLSIGQQIASGLVAAHSLNIVHRDIKPGNILLEGDDLRVKISDFGLARTADDASLTQSGTIAGTPLYMSPEQARGRVVDARSDLFSLGSVLYVMCSGRPPFRAANTLAVLLRVAQDEPRPIREVIPEVPQWLCDIIARLQAKDPEQRFASSAEVADLLARCIRSIESQSNLESPSELAPEFLLQLPPAYETCDERSPGRNTQSGSLVRAKSLSRRPKLAIAAAILLLLGSLALTEAAGVTRLSSTVIRLFSEEGTLAIQVDDPNVAVTIDGQDVVISGTGVKELRLRPGQYRLQASKDGRLLQRELVTVTRNGRQTVRVSQTPTMDVAPVEPLAARIEAVPPSVETPPNSLSIEEQQQGFELLFNGEDLSGWRTRGVWKVQDGAISREGRGGDLEYITKTMPDDFELRFDWKVAPGSNSGIYYRPGQYEYQILDNAGHANGKLAQTSAASLYYVFPPNRDATRPVGEWNHGRIVCQGTVIQHWLNGEKVVDIDYSDPALRNKVEALNRRGANLADRGGNLYLQDNGSAVWFRSIKLRSLAKTETLDGAPGNTQADPHASQGQNAKQSMEWALSVGGTLGVNVDKRIVHLKMGDSIPQNVSAVSILRLESIEPAVRVDNQTIENLSDIPPVSTIVLRNSRIQVDDAGLAKLVRYPGLTNIKQMSIGHLPISGQGLGQLSACSNLQWIVANNVPLSAEAFEKLTNVPLTTLWLDYCSVTDDVAAAIGKLPNLRDEILSNAFSNEGLAEIAKIPNLKWLTITDSKKITDAGIAHIKACESLERVSLVRCRTTAVAIQDLASARPDLAIQWDGGWIARTKTEDLNSKRTDESEALQWLFDQGARANLSDGTHAIDATEGQVPDIPFTLETLNLLPAQGLDDTSVEILKRLPAIHLRLYLCKSISPDGVADWFNTDIFAEIRELDTCSNPITDAVLEPISRMRMLHSLCISSPEISDNGLEDLSRHPRLNRLTIKGTRLVTDAGLAHIAKIKTLNHLALIDCGITQEGVQNLASVRPDIHVEWSGATDLNNP